MRHVARHQAELETLNTAIESKVAVCTAELGASEGRFRQLSATGHQSGFTRQTVGAIVSILTNVGPRFLGYPCNKALVMDGSRLFIRETARASCGNGNWDSPRTRF